MSDKLILAVHGSLAPEGTPERDYWKTSLRYPASSEQFKAAEARLIAEGCPQHTSDFKPVWDGSKWSVIQK
jgi:hypothetical protein